MPSFKQEFEIRRILFGFTAMLKCDKQMIPAAVSERLPYVMAQISKLALQCHKERLENLEKNEKYIANGFESDDDEEDQDSDADNDEDGMDDGTEKLMKKLKKFKDGQPNEDDDISDDSDDSDYAENAGEYSLYDSPLEEVDELVTIK